MTYGLSSFRQLSNFLSAVGFGFLIGLIYILFQFFRQVISNGKIAYFVCDILFSVSYTLLCFAFIFSYNEGEIRLDLLFAMIIGFFAFYFTIGKYLQKLLSLVSNACSSVLEKAFLPFKKLTVMIGKALKFLLNKLKINKVESSKAKKDKRENKKGRKIKNNHRKSKQNFKRYLKKSEKSV